MIFEYKTIAAPVEEVLLKEKGSKFIGYAFPVKNEAEAKKQLEILWEKHPKATHICYAYRIGLQGEIYRANDDGEPSGSAGLPIYNQLLANEITHVLLAVVRYYGGTKLGVSGLVKTYKESAKLTLDEAIMMVRALETTVRIQFQYHQQNTIFTVLNKVGAQIISFDAAESCVIQATLKMEQKESISEVLSEMLLVEYQFID
ncbi:MAG: YigZ family protein [Bacteroidetes bacterium]|nr:YigZ family protein [Bacteroidota bacterium]